MSLAGHPKSDLIEKVLLEELRARHVEIDMLNQQIGTIYRLSVSAIGATAIILGLRTNVSGSDVFSTFIGNDVSRIASSSISLIFISLLLLKNQYNSRISRQAKYIQLSIRPRLLALCGQSTPIFLDYETFAEKYRADFFSNKRILKSFAYENLVLILPFVFTMLFSIIGSFYDCNYIELSINIIIFILGIFVWRYSGDYIQSLDTILNTENK